MQENRSNAFLNLIKKAVGLPTNESDCCTRQLIPELTNESPLATAPDQVSTTTARDTSAEATKTGA